MTDDPFGLGPSAASFLLPQPNVGQPTLLQPAPAQPTYSTPATGPVVASMAGAPVATPAVSPALLPLAAATAATTAPSTSDTEAKRAVLAKIASGEAHQYNEVYNGPAFTDYGDHPRQRHVITEGPHKGETSDAAGLYQFLSSTWDAQKAKLGLKDFSPASQDVAAWDLAATTYHQTTGRDLLADAKVGKVDYGKLAGQWPSLAGGGGEGGGGEGAVAARAAKGATAAPGTGGGGGTSGTGTFTAPTAPGGPEMFSQMMKLQLLRSLFPKQQFTSVEYDPFKVMPGRAEKVDVNHGVG